MLRRLVEFVRTAGAPSESDTERNGFLSYSGETHALGHGLYDGMKSIKPVPDELPDNSDVQNEPVYYKGAYVLGTLVQFGVVVGGTVLGLL